ncbi:hypothetical protein [Quadrisphaera granulorum]|uniref:hypothetical protein n=1 Tax=Quadrisphaera granulorum TaxID=317664 RepID=UPI0011B36B62|nr:hypothetical protein [Quadrisphaera granulorum]
MIVEVRAAGRPGEVVDREVPAPIGTTTLRRLLTALVQSEVEAYEARRSEQLVLRVLTPADLALGHADGRFRGGGRSVPAAPALATAVARALEAFEDGLVLALLDGEPVDDLDADVHVDVRTRLRLVRLVALTGG